jgi:hypothetical protein
MKILSMDELVDYLKSLGNIEIITPQFQRTDGIKPVIPESNTAWFDKLKELPHETLKAIGMGLWKEGYYLFPKEWYSFIPAGYIVTDINGDDEAFIPNVTDDNIRFGCLSYGFKKAGIQ